MRLREMLWGALLALGIAPAVLLALSLLPGVLDAFEMAAHQTALARAQLQAQQLTQRLERRKETVRNIAMLPAVWEMLQADGEVGPQLDSGQAAIRFDSVMRRWFAGSSDVRAVVVTDSAGRERARLSASKGVVTSSAPAAVAPELGAHFAEALAGRCAEPHAVLIDGGVLRLFIPIRCSNAGIPPVGLLILDLDLEALLAGYQDALWVDGSGRTVHGGALGAFTDFAALRMTARVPTVLYDAHGDDTAWVPLLLDDDDTGVLWVGRPVDNAEQASWLDSLRTRSLLLVVMLALAVMLAVQRGIEWLVGIKGQMLDGLRGILAGQDTVTFAWNGPAEVTALARDLTALGRMHVATRKAHALAEQQLWEEKAWAEATLRSITDGVVTTDPDGRVIAMNPAAERLLRHRGETVGRPLDELFSVVDDLTRAPLKLPALLSIAEDCAVDTGLDALLVRADGREVPIQAAAAPMHRADGSIAGAVVVMRDVGQERRLQRLLVHQASHDALTGLANRSAFEMVLTQALAEARRHPDAGLWLCYVDLDQFKMINDSCGHQAGDQLLQQVALELKAAVRDCDMVARMGGDEFAVLLKRCTQDGAVHIIDRMRRRLAEFRFAWQDESFLTAGSFGLVPLHAGSGSLYDLLSAADSACYIAKERGRNRIHLADGQDEAVRQYGGEIKWAHETIRAIEDDRLCLYFQPIKPLKHDGGLHIEILVRMIDTEGRLVAPGVFIPAAERYNLMRDVDRWVLRETLTTFADTPSDSVISVNLSGQSLCDDDFLEFAQSAIKASGIDPQVLCFEITETAAMSNLIRAQEVIRTLQASGCRFALDDFGSGLSSFGYLKNLPINYLKIDGSFVKNILDQPLDRAFVQSMSDLGHLMGIATIAEYVENAEIERVLVDIGVDFAQGYGIAPPRPISVLFREMAAAE